MYSIKEAAARSGVSIATLRAWERRYGVVAPQRTPSGYRLYDEEAIRRLRQMRRLLSEGWRAREAAAEVVSGRAAEIVPEPPGGDGPSPEVAGADELVDEFVAAVMPFDLARVEAALDEAFSRAAFEPAMERVVFPALREVGRLWSTGSLTVAAEHAASHTVLRRLSMLYDAAARPSAHHEIIVGLPPRARHDLGALAFAIAARRRGIDVLYLGADVPIDSWLAAMRETGATFAVIAVPTPDDAASATDVLRALSGAVPGVRILTGGGGAETVSTSDAAVLLPQDIAAAARLVGEQLAERGAVARRSAAAGG